MNLESWTASRRVSTWKGAHAFRVYKIFQAVLADTCFPCKLLWDLRQQLRWEEFVSTPASLDIRIGNRRAQIGSTAKRAN
jgi:hypothetical protein